MDQVYRNAIGKPRMVAVAVRDACGCARSRALLQYAAELLEDVAVLLTVLNFLGAVAICVAILFYTFCR